MKKVLVLSPHSDDELFGVGGTLLRHKKNKDEIFGLLLCNRGKEYVKEYKNGMRQMGAQKLFLEQYPDCKFETYPVKDLADSIMRVIDEIRVLTEFMCLLLAFIRTTKLLMMPVLSAFAQHPLLFQKKYWNMRIQRMSLELAEGLIRDILLI